MAKRKEHVSKHLVSAKEWVSRAEQSFETQKDIRGELDLFLAQAELAQAKKASRLHRLTEYSFFKQSAALFIALFVAAFGLGASYWFNAHLPAEPPETTVSGKNSPPNHPITRAGNTLPSKAKTTLPHRPDNDLLPQSGQALILPESTSGTTPVLTKETAENPTIAATAMPVPQPQPQQERSYSPVPVSVSKEQMQNLIRSAGNSLRSEN